MSWQRSRIRLDAQNRAFWTGGSEGKLYIAKCNDCGGFIHPPREICRHCQSENVAPFAVSGNGRIDTYTVNHQKWAPDMEVPFVIARISLDASGPAIAKGPVPIVGAPGFLITASSDSSRNGDRRPNTISI